MDGSDVQFGVPRWSQFGADAQGQGFLAENTRLAVSPLLKWEVEIGRVGFSSPVIGPDGTVYVGNLAGELVAVSPDGNVQGRTTFFDGSTIVGTPAVAEDGSIFVVITHEVVEDLPVSKLNKVSPDGDWLWNRPAATEDRFTTASPKVYGDHVFLWVPHELAVYDFDGNLVDRESAIGCTPVCGEGFIDFGDIVDFFEGCLGVSDPHVPIVGCFATEFDTSGIPVPPPDASVAIIDNPTVTGDELSIIVVVNRYCMTGLRFNDPELEFVWQETVYGGGCGDDPVVHASPAILPGGLLVIANEDGEVEGYDPATGNLLWEYDAEEEVLGSAASFGRPIFIASTKHLHSLETNGGLIRKVDLLGDTQGSPALSSNLAYLSTNEGLYTFSFDLTSESTLDIDADHGLSTPAIAEDGTVYAMTGDGMLRAYSPDVGTVAMRTLAVNLTDPAEGSDVVAGDEVAFNVTVSSPDGEPFNGEILIDSDLDGELCTVSGSGDAFSCTGAITTLGSHQVTASAIDETGALATDQIGINVVQPILTVMITSPQDGVTLVQDEDVLFSAELSFNSSTGYDGSVTFSSDVEGELCSVIGFGPGLDCTDQLMTLGTHEVTAMADDISGLTAEDSVMVNVVAGNSPPSVTVVDPADGAEFEAGQEINFSAQVVDPDETIPDASVAWTSDIDGPIGTGRMLAATLSKETHAVTATATDSGGLAGQDTVSITVVPGPGVPTATIVSPDNLARFGPAQTITFEATGTDPEDGDLPDDSFRWISNHDGVLGTGRTIETTLSGNPDDPCEDLRHTITLEVTDSDGNTTQAEIQVETFIIC